MRYTVWYEGDVYYGDTPDTWNKVETNDVQEAFEEYNYMMSIGVQAEVADNDYDVVFYEGEWH